MGNGVRQGSRKFNTTNTNAPEASGNSKKQHGQLANQIHALFATKNPLCVLTRIEKEETHDAWYNVENKTKLGNLILTRIFRAEPSMKRLFRLNNVEDAAMANHKRFLHTAHQLASFFDTVVNSLSDDHEQMTAVTVKSCRTFGAKHIKEYDNTESIGLQYWRLLPEASADALEDNEMGVHDDFHDISTMNHVKYVWSFRRKFMSYEFLRVKPGAFSPSAVGQQDDNPTWHLIMQSLMTNDSRPGKQNVLNIPEKIPKERIVSLVNRIIHMFMREPTLLEIEPPVTICGDTHGQFIDFLDIVDSVGWPPNQRYLFLGDYIDRGDQSIELICLLYLLKVQNPHNFFILRGNHETSEVNAEYGFKDDCMRDYDLSVWDLFQESFKSLPLAAVVGSRIICMHGGLSPCLSSLDDIRKVPRPLDIPNDGLVCDVLWSDPMPKHAHDRFCGYPKNMSRSTSVWFCSDSTREFLLRNNLDLVVRGHEVTDEGYEFTEDKKVLTVFSAPYYCGHPNNASVLHVDEELRCQIRPHVPVQDEIIGPAKDLWNEVTLRATNDKK